MRRKAEVLLFVFAIKPLDQIKTAVLLGRERELCDLRSRGHGRPKTRELLTALSRGGDRNHADRGFDFADLVLTVWAAS